jgi:hypothetical protein
MLFFENRIASIGQSLRSNMFETTKAESPNHQTIDVQVLFEEKQRIS